jgi:ubiquinone/menaquinone biosynthesis C-methylase UbiE
MSRRLLLLIVPILLLAGRSPAQEKSVRPGINKAYEKPDVRKLVGFMEGESREISRRRAEIVRRCELKPGMVVADIGAGTGLFTRLFAREVGPDGQVYAVEISQALLDHIGKSCTDQGIANVSLVRCTPMSCELEAGSVDLAFVCDTYHHFEFPFRTLASIHRALKPDGQLIVIDFKRIPGITPDSIVRHVRAGQEVFAKEIVEAGFKLVEEIPFMKENYFLRFEKRIRSPKDDG